MFTNREHSPAMLGTVEAVIEALGGTAATAALAGCKSPAVSNWRSRGRIPAELFLVFSEALSGKGKQVDPALFGMARAAGADA